MKLKKTVLAIGVILALLVNSVVFAVDNKNNAENSYWLDTVVFADDNTHNVSADSNSGIKTLTTMRIGEFTDEKYTVLVGDRNSYTLDYYISLEGSNTVYIIEATTITVFNKTISDLK